LAAAAGKRDSIALEGKRGWTAATGKRDRSWCSVSCHACKSCMTVACAPCRGVAGRGGSTRSRPHECVEQPTLPSLSPLGLTSSSTTLRYGDANSGGSVADLVANGGLWRRHGWEKRGKWWVVLCISSSNWYM
jgi:hypothetical protein